MVARSIAGESLCFRMTIEYTVQIWNEGGQFVAHAMPLDVASSGRTLEEARAAVEEAVRCFLKTAHDAGTLTQVLEESGYERRGGDWVSPAWVGVERRAVAV